MVDESGTSQLEDLPFDFKKGDVREQQESIRYSTKVESVVKNLQRLYESHTVESSITKMDIESRRAFLTSKGVHPSWISKEELTDSDGVASWADAHDEAKAGGGARKQAVIRFEEEADMARSIDEAPNIDLISRMATDGYERRQRVYKKEIENARMVGEKSGRKHASFFWTEAGIIKTEEFLKKWE